MSIKPGALVGVCVSFLGLALALAVVELGVRRLFSSDAAQGPAWSDRPAFYFAAPGRPSMQGLPYQIPKPPNTFRIAVVGDSFSFAPYMQFTDTFAFKLEQMLNAQGAERRAEVINYGVPAYSTTHEIPVVTKAMDEGADVIVLQITLNDPEVKAHRPTGIVENMHDKFAPKKLSGMLGALASHWKTLGFVAGRIHNTQSKQLYIDYFNDLFSNPRSWNPFAEALGGISKACAARDTPLVAVIFPLFGIPMTESYPFFPIHKKVDQLLTDVRVRHLDISSIYNGIPLERLQVIPGVDRHPNEIAHRMAAERIYLWLEELHLIPDEFRLTERYATRLGIEKQRKIGDR
jgi:hypothetical protein